MLTTNVDSSPLRSFFLLWGIYGKGPQAGRRKYFRNQSKDVKHFIFNVRRALRHREFKFSHERIDISISIGMKDCNNLTTNFSFSKMQQ